MLYTLKILDNFEFFGKLQKFQFCEHLVNFGKGTPQIM